MHLLAVTPGQISDGEEAVDLGQSPGDILILTTADSELTCFARAASQCAAAGVTVRLANLLQLRHPYSVDLYLDQVIAHARFVAVVLLGGRSYWPYGIDRIAEMARERGIVFAALSGDAEDDPDLSRASTLPRESRRLLQACLRHGGVGNAALFLQEAMHLIGKSDAPGRAPEALSDVGLHPPAGCAPTLEDIRNTWGAGKPTALFIFYRALTAAGTLEAVDAMIAALEALGLNVLPVYVRGLREAKVIDWLRATLEEVRPDVILNATSFAASSLGEPRTGSVLEEADCPILQTCLAAVREEDWQQSSVGLGARDLAMNVALPEVDGRIFTRAYAFKSKARFDPLTECTLVEPQIAPDRAEFIAAFAANWARLRRLPPAERRVALVLANYPNQNGRIGNGVGLDTPAACLEILNTLAVAGYAIADKPSDGQALMSRLVSGVTNAIGSAQIGSKATLPVADYKAWFANLPAEVQDLVTQRWGLPETDTFVCDGQFQLPIHCFGSIVVGVQPARGYNIDPKSSCHDPDLPPTHGYLAFYCWLRTRFGCHAMVHVGKHGTAEWLPGKALSLSAACFPEVVTGPVPQIYPFIVNDPGEGTQAKRRIGAVILDHLTPPLTRAESHGPLRQLEALIDEYYQAASMDARRLPGLKRDILDLAHRNGLAVDAGIGTSEEDTLANLDNYLCDLKELQIRNGLHIFGCSPAGQLRLDLLISLARTPRHGRSADDPGAQSLLRALANDFQLGFDPLDCVLNAPWDGPHPDALARCGEGLWRTTGDTIERLEEFSLHLVSGKVHPPGPASAAVLNAIQTDLAPRVDACGPAERAALLTALDGRFVPPGPSGAPTRGRPDVLPTGRNFYSVDTRSVPTPMAWRLGEQSARLLVEDYLQREGVWPKAMAVTAWGTSNMRTGGDDIAQALALMGVRPRWEWSSGRVTGFEVISLAELGRPRVDVTFRISGFFRDAFPEQIALLDSAARAVMAAEENADDNPAAARFRAEKHKLEAAGVSPEQAALRAGSRVYGSRPGAYGAGLQTLIDERIWETRADLGKMYLEWGSYAYGGGQDGISDLAGFSTRLSQVDASVHNQDNREHDLLDSDDYYQFEGGIAAAIEHLTGRAPLSYHLDHSRPEKPVVRTLDQEVARIVRGRLTNPKWIEGVMRHGYKGAFEIAASIDYLFGFAAATNAVRDHHFDAVFSAFIEDERVRAFLKDHNPDALQEIMARLAEALERGLWQPRSNSTAISLQDLRNTLANRPPEGEIP